jgi:hypothetical protein
MKNNTILSTYLLIILIIGFTISCGQSSESGNADEHEMVAMEHSEEEMMTEEGFVWTPTHESMTMMEYKTDNITLATSGEEDVLMFEPAGQRASCMFKNRHGDIGITATIKIEDPEGSVKLLHHSADRDNYEFVMLEHGVMKLGRVEHGEEKIFDEKEVDVPQDWFTLTVTAAGTEYKGYLNDQIITSGSAERMKPGLLGIVASGNGKVLVKKIEALPIENKL